MNQLRAFMAKRIGGVPVPVILLGVVVVAYLVIRHRNAVKANADNPTTGTATDTTGSDLSPIGAMQSGGGFAGAGYDVPQPSAGGTSADTSGGFDGLLNSDAGDTTVTGGPTPSTSAPAKSTPPKVSPAKSAHRASTLKPHTLPPVKAPARRSTVHAAPKTVHPPARTKPVVKPAVKKPAVKKPAVKKPTYGVPGYANKPTRD